MRAIFDGQLSLEEIQKFGRLSGDLNPLHGDPVVARRTLFGGVVAHGVHLGLLALDRDPQADGSPSQLHFHFHSPVFPDERYEAVVVTEQAGQRTYEIRAGGRAAVSLEVAWSEAQVGASEEDPALPRALPAETPRVLRREDIAPGLRGEFPPALDRELCRKIFPRLSARYSARLLAELLGLSRTVGMHCPGLHSISAEYRIELGAFNGGEETQYVVKRFDSRMSRLELEVRGQRLRADIVALLRPEPVRQVTFAEVAQSVPDRRIFSAQRALVVGGSRGLGELVTKLIAAGGGGVVSTYFLGAEDAARVCEEIGSSMVSCRFLDVLSPSSMAEALAGIAPFNALYYFAGPRAMPARGAGDLVVDPARYRAYYVDGLERVVRAASGGGGPLAVFNPSSRQLDERRPGLPEFAEAKAQSEKLCAELARAAPNLRFEVRRLPALRTDQAQSMWPQPGLQDPLPLMREVVESMQP